MAYLRRVNFRQGKYAGIRVIGADDVTVADFKGTGDGLSKHMNRASYLATKLESPQWGTVQSYDNAGISAGPFHWIAHYPASGKQGPIFGLLRAIELACPDFIVSNVWEMLYDAGWYVATDGKLRSTKNGSLISGKKIRDVVAAPKGLVPKSGSGRKSADAWALAFHELMARPECRRPQIQYAIQYLNRGQSKIERQVYRRVTNIPSLMDPGIVRIKGEGPTIDPQTDLALAAYHAHSVNAPSPAVSVLKSCLPALKQPDPGVFAKRLIRALAMKKYGNWAKRYTHTRTKAMASGLWDTNLFKGKSATMPAKFI